MGKAPTTHAFFSGLGVHNYGFIFPAYQHCAWDKASWSQSS